MLVAQFLVDRHHRRIGSTRKHGRLAALLSISNGADLERGRHSLPAKGGMHRRAKRRQPTIANSGASGFGNEERVWIGLRLAFQPSGKVIKRYRCKGNTLGIGPVWRDSILKLV